MMAALGLMLVAWILSEVWEPLGVAFVIMCVLAWMSMAMINSIAKQQRRSRRRWGR